MPVFPLRVERPPATEDEGLRLWQEEVSDVLGAFAQNIRTVTANATVTTSDRTIFCDATSGAIIITLPPVADAVSFEVNIKKTDSSANTVTIAGSGSETIDDSTTAVITVQYEAVTVHSDGIEWGIL